MKKDLIIVGAGGFAREILWLAISCGRSVAGFLDDHAEGSIDGVPILGKVADARTVPRAEFVVAIGSPRVRRSVVSALGLSEERFATLIHPRAEIGHKVKIGNGSLITAGCVVTTNVNFGAHSILNINSTVGHDVRCGSFSTIAPIVAVSGNVKIYNGVEIGTGSSIRQGVEIGEGAVVGMGACVVKNVDANTVVVGNPARNLKVIDTLWNEI